MITQWDNSDVYFSHIIVSPLFSRASDSLALLSIVS